MVLRGERRKTRQQLINKSSSESDWDTEAEILTKAEEYINIGDIYLFIFIHSSLCLGSVHAAASDKGRLVWEAFGLRSPHPVGIFSTLWTISYTLVDTCRAWTLCVGATAYYSLVTGMANCEVCDWAGPVVNEAH